MPVLKRICLISLVILSVACGGGGSSSPTSPSTSAAASGTRVIGVSGSLAFGNVTVGQSANATFTISNSGNTTLTVSSLTLPAAVSGAYAASFTSGPIAAGASQTVNVRCSPTAAQDYSATVTVNGDQTSGANTIVASCVGVLPPGVAATRIIGVTGNLAFGNVAVGQTGSLTFTITNTGNSTLTIAGITIPNCAATFSATWTNGTIPPGGSQQVTQTYSPTSTQSCSGTLTVNGDQTSGTNTLPISGSGTPSTTPTPSPSPSPSTGGKYDGTYGLNFAYACPGGTCTTNATLVIRNGVVNSTDGLLTGTVDNTFGNLRATSVCPYNSSQATWTGIMNASALAGSNFGQGQYSCANPGTVFNWTARQQ